MKNKKTKKINILSHILLILTLFLSPISTAWAIDVNKIMGVQSPTEFIDKIFSDLGVDKEQVRYGAQTFNVANKKKTPPQVTLFFNPANPDEGEKVTVTASPSYFLNNPEELYYTWFLKTANCTDEETDDDDYTYNSECDLNNDGEVDIEDYKIKAMRIIVNGGFDYTSVDYSSSTDSNNDSYDAFSGGNDQEGKTAYCYVHDIKTGEEYALPSCGDNKTEQHLFAHAEYENFIDKDGNQIDLDEETGDDDFGRDEEKFWHTDPNSNDTANLGHSDEANVAGLGVLTFSWNYQKGDKVGVVVEGISTEPTQTEDSSYKTMWAMNKGNYTLDADNNIGNDYPQTTTTTTITEDTPEVGQTTTVTVTTLEELSNIVNEIATIETTITTQTVVTDSADPTTIISDETEVSNSAEIENMVGDFDISNDDIGSIEKPSDLNDFLYDALVSPQENSAGSDKLDISLSYSPTNPINDSSGESGDTLIIQSSIPNAKDNNYLQYNWQVFSSDEVNPNDWGTPLLKSDLKESTQTTGLGIDTFKFKLALNEPKKYLRILLTVTENVGEEYPRSSRQDIIIPIISMDANDQISTHSVLAETDSIRSVEENPSGVNLKLDEEICTTNNIDRAICPVTKSQIIGLSFPAEDEDNFPSGITDFLWTIDGKPISYSFCFFDNCNPEKQTNTAYFPILKEIGEQYTIGFTATSAEGEKINLTKIFKVVDPEIEINFVDDVCPKTNSSDICHRNVLGKYFDVNSQEFTDYSKLNFWARNDSDIKLEAEVTGFSASPESYSWNIDGQNISASNADLYGFTIDSEGILTLPPKEIRGESYNITVGTLYTQENLVKKALKDIWGVTYNQFYEKTIADEAIITMMDAEEITQGPAKKIFASVYSSVPSYLAFLLRIILTISLILFTTKLIFSFSAPINSREEN